MTAPLVAARRAHGQPGAVPDARPRGPAPADGPRLPVTWPLVVLFVAFPVWWVLGAERLHLDRRGDPDAGVADLAAVDPSAGGLHPLARLHELGPAVRLPAGRRHQDRHLFLPARSLRRCRGAVRLHLQPAALVAARHQDPAHPHGLLDDRGGRGLRRHPGRRAYVHAALRVAAASTDCAASHLSRNSSSRSSPRCRTSWLPVSRGPRRHLPTATTGAATWPC